MTAPASAKRPAFWMISGAFSFTVMGALTHAIGDRCDWLTIAFSRAIFMLVTSVAAAKLAGSPLAIWKPRTLWVRSFAGSFSLVCSFFALTKLPVGEVLTLTNTYPLWILVLSWLTTKRAPRPFEVISVALGLAGLILIEQPSLSGDQFAAAVALISSVSTAVAMLGLHRLRDVDSKAVVAHFAGVATIISGVWLLGRIAADGMPRGSLDTATIMMVLGVGISGTLGQICLTKAYATGAPARVSVLALTQVVFGLAFDVLIWQRSVPAISLVGTLLILGPSAWLLARTSPKPLPNKPDEPTNGNS